MDDHAKSAIALIFMRGGRLESPIDLTPLDQKTVVAIGGEVSKVTGALNSLKDSLIVQESTSEQRYWKYKHPTIKDAFSSIVAENPEHLDVYLMGTPIEQIMKEVSCGVEVEGAKITVPSSRYEQIIGKLDFSTKSRWERRPLDYFLAERCGKVFLEQLLTTNPQYLGMLNVGSFLSISSEVTVLARLKGFALLPEENRLKAIQQISDLAIETPDSDFLRGSARSLLHEEEVQNILERIKNELLPRLDDVIDEWKSNYDEGESPESHFDALREALKDYQEHIEDEPSKNKLQCAIGKIDDLIFELEVDYKRNDDGESFFTESSTADASNQVTGRSIFDDVDS